MAEWNGMTSCGLMIKVQQGARALGLGEACGERHVSKTSKNTGKNTNNTNNPLVDDKEALADAVVASLALTETEKRNTPQ